MSNELKQHQVEFERLMRLLLVNVVKAKLGPLTTLANDALHKLDHIEKLRYDATLEQKTQPCQSTDNKTS